MTLPETPVAPLTSSPPTATKSIELSLRVERFPWEFVAYALLIVLALAVRLWDLGARAYHYDEAIHAFDSWQLFTKGIYHHSPWTHGPFPYEISALGIAIFGDNWVAPRIFPALFGAALVLMPIFLRGQLGRWGALAAATLLAFSPSLLYFSRFLRHDIFVIFFDVALLVCIWRFISSKRNLYLYLGALALALSFSTEETAFINVAAVGSFFGLWWLRGRLLPLVNGKLRRRIRTLRPRFRGRPRNAKAGMLFFFGALTLPLGGAVIGMLLDHLPLGLTMVLEQGNNAAGIVGAPVGTLSRLLAGVIVAGLFLVAVVCAWRWRFGVWLLALALFYGLFILLHTTFLTNMVGLGTGFWQSLGYWIAQQPVERAGQPWYYYLMTLSLYEFLPLLFAIAAVVWCVVKRGVNFTLLALILLVISALVGGITYQVTGHKLVYAPLAIGLALVIFLGIGRGNKFEWFLVHWALVTVLLYIIAGEKMPWLTTHLAVPLVLLAARFIGELIATVPWRAVARNGGIALLAAVPLLAGATYALVTQVDDTAPIGRWGFVGALAFSTALLLVAWLLWRRAGGPAAWRLVALSAVVLLGLFTLRAGFEVSFANGDDPREMLLYSQTGPEVAGVVREIDRLAETSRRGSKLTILADTSGAAFAQWRWYLRNYPNTQHIDMSSSTATIDQDVVLLADSNVGKLDKVRERYGEAVHVNINQWFNPWAYKGYTPKKFLADLRDSRQWNRLLHFFVYRAQGPEPSFQAAYAYYGKHLAKPALP